MAPGLLQIASGRERRGVDRPIKRLRQLLARLDVLLTESQALRNINALDRLTWPALARQMSSCR